MKIAQYDDLIAQYENPIEDACTMQLGQTFLCNGWERPEGFCGSAWDTVSPFVMALAHGGENFYEMMADSTMHFWYIIAYQQSDDLA